MIRVTKHIVIAEIRPDAKGKMGPLEAAFAAIGADRDVVSESELGASYEIDHPTKDGHVMIDVGFNPRPDAQRVEDL